MKLIKSTPLGNGFHAHVCEDGSILITGKWAEDTLLLSKKSVDTLYGIVKGLKNEA
jgi:hypothetical protein